MKYLRKFNTEADVSSWQMSEDHVKPNAALVGDTGSVLYNVKALSGVMIQHIDGSFYTTDEWTAGGFSNDVANGVAVIDANASFVIAKTQISSRMTWSSDTSTLVEGVFTTTDSTTAKTDYAGAANTALIAAIDTSKAAYSCANFEFPNGQKGYLPALGEWIVAYNNKTAIDAAMALIEGTAINTSYYHWSSTQDSASRAWEFYWDTGDTSNFTKNNYYPVRAFSALSL